MRIRFVILGLLAVSVPLSGAPWIGHGPVGVRVTALAGHDSTTLYAGTDGIGFFRSGDNGRTWTEINDSKTAHAFVYSMVTDATGTVFAMANIGLLASRDRGSSWTTISTSYTGISGRLAIDGSTLYAIGLPFNLARTSDGGATWEQLITGIKTGDDYVSGVAIHANTLVVSESSGFYRSSDHGKNWSRVSTTYGTSAGVLSDGTFLGGTLNSGVLRSTDDGQTWIGSNVGLNDAALISPVLGIIPGSGATVYLDSNVGGSARSDDGGRTWTMTNDGFVPAPDISAMTLVGATLYASSQPGVYRRGDAERAWSITAALPGYGSIWSLSANATTTWASVDNQIWRSVDGGVTWMTGNAGGAAIAADPSSGAIAYTGTARIGNHPVTFRPTISRTSDSGVTWTALWTGDVGAAVQALAVDPRSSQWLYGGLKDGLVRSSDGGATWSAALPGESVVAFAFDALTVYAATATGVFVSHDDGATWTRTLSGAVVAVASTTRFAYAATDSTIFSSLDHGASWTRVSNGPASISALASAPSDRLFVASAGDVFELRDNIDWTRRSDAQAGSPITALLFRDEKLIAGTSASGVLSLTLPLRARAVRPR